MKKLRFQTILGAASLLFAHTVFAQNAATTTIVDFPDVAAGSTQAHLLPVRLPAGVDTTSFDSRDIWVVSLQGYNKLARFVRFERPATVVPADANGAVVQDAALLPAPTPVTAFYEVAPPEGGWKEGDELFTVLLQPGEIRLAASTTTAGTVIPVVYLPPSRLGDFRVVTPPPPPPPVAPTAMVTVQPDSAGNYSAKVTLKLPSNLEVAEWGQPVREGDIFTIASTSKTVEPATGAAPVRVLTKSFPLDLTETPVTPPVDAPYTAPTPVPFTVVQAPPRSLPGTFVIQSLTQWNALWTTTNTAAGVIASPTSLPAAPVSFDTRTLLGIALGYRSSGGFGIVVDSVASGTDGVVTVTWHETAPGPNDAVTLATTTPTLWLSLAKETRPIRFVNKANVTMPPVVTPPVVTKVYTVNYSLDGKKLASTRFVKQPTTPVPTPVPFPASKVQAVVEGTTAKVTVTLPSAEAAARIGSWGTVERRDRVLVAKAVSRTTTDPAPALVPPLTHTYEVADLADGAWQFLFTVDGQVAGAAGWIVGTVPPPVVTPPVVAPGDPAQGDPTVGLENGSAMVLTFVRNPTDGSTFVVEVSTDLKTWTALDPDQYTTETRTLPDGLETVVIRLPETTGATRYARLRVLSP